MKTLIKNGTVVSATGTAVADVLIDGETIAAVLAPGSTLLGFDLEHNVDAVIDATGKLRHPGRHRRPHPHGNAVRRHEGLRHLRDRHARGGVGRHDEHRRLRGAVRGRERARPVRAVAREGRRQLRDRLRLPPDLERCAGFLAHRDGRACRRGRLQLQAVHGLQGRVPLRRRADRQGHAARRHQRQHDHDARRERQRDRRSRAAGARGGQHGAVLSRHHPPMADGGGGHPPRDHARRHHRGTAVRGPRLRQAGRRTDRACPRAGPERVR